MNHLFSNKKVTKSRQDIKGYAGGGSCTTCGNSCANSCSGCTGTCSGICTAACSSWSTMR